MPATLDFTGQMFGNVWQGILSFPERIPALWDALGGGVRDENTPVSVVGASIIGGDAAERGLWEYFVLLLALLNFFVGVFNLLPLLPLDGGHIAVNLYERVRDSVRARLGKPKMPPVDYTRLLPLTYFVILVGRRGEPADPRRGHRQPDPARVTGARDRGPRRNRTDHAESCDPCLR